MSVTESIISDRDLQVAYIGGNGTEIVGEGLRAVAEAAVTRYMAGEYADRRNPVAASLDRLTAAVDRIVQLAEAPSIKPPIPETARG